MRCCFYINLIVGDININILLKANNDVNSYLIVLTTHGCSPMYQETTRPDSGSWIDHVFLRKRTKTCRICINPVIINYDLMNYLPILKNMHYKNLFDGDSNNLHTIPDCRKTFKLDYSLAKKLASKVNLYH